MEYNRLLLTLDLAVVIKVQTLFFITIHAEYGKQEKENISKKHSGDSKYT